MPVTGTALVGKLQAQAVRQGGCNQILPESSRCGRAPRPGTAEHAVRYLEIPAWLVTLVVFGTVAVIIMIAYLLPVLVGWSRHVLDVGSVAVINIELS